LNDATITQIAREVDPKSKCVAVKNETYGIYGYCDFNVKTTCASASFSSNAQ